MDGIPETGSFHCDYVKRALARGNVARSSRFAREGYKFRRVDNLVVACRRKWCVMRERIRANEPDDDDLVRGRKTTATVL